MIKGNSRCKKAIVINDTRREVGHLGCSLVMRNIIHICKTKSIEVLFSDESISEDFDESDFLSKVEKVDCLILNGEGTLHYNGGSGLIKKAEMAKDRGKQVILINSVWQNNFYAKKYLYIFDRIYVRESFSYKEIIRDGAKNVDVVPDMSFYS